MPRTRLALLAFGAALALAPSLWAQTTRGRSAAAPDPGTTKAARPGAAPTQGGNAPGQGQPWDTPEQRLRRLRMMVGGGFGGPGGGRGGRGGQAGGVGGAMTQLLLSSPALQEALGVTPAQKQKLELVSQTLNDRRREIFSQMRNNNNRGGGRNGGGNNGGGNNGGGNNGGGRGGFGGPNGNAMREAMTAIQQQSEMALQQTLSAKQLKRLNQIRLRIIGPMAVVEPEVAEEIALMPEQVEEVNLIIRQMRDAQNAQRRSMFAMFRGPGGGGPGGGGPGAGGRNGNNGNNNGGGNAAPAPTQGRVPNNGGPGAGVGNGGPGVGNGGPGVGNGGPGNGGRGAGRPDFNSPQFREQMQKAGEQEDALRVKTEKMIGKVLTAGQRASFNRLLGPPIDLASLAPEMNRRNNGPGNRNGGNNRPGRNTNNAADDDESAVPTPGRTAPPAGRVATQPQPATGDDDEEAPRPKANRRNRPAPRVRGQSPPE